MPNEGGFIVLNRSIEDWQYWGCESAVAIWLHILVRANWKDGWFMGVPIPRGSFATSIQNFADEVGCHPNTVRKWLKRFEEAGQIECKSTNKFTLINVINYAKFQDIPDERVKRDVKQSVKQDVKQSVNQSVNQSVKQRVDNRTNKQSNKVTKETNILNTFAPSDSENHSMPEKAPKKELANVAEIYLNDGSTWKPTVEDYEKFKKLYMAVDIDQEFRKMSGWSLANPAKRKTKAGVMRFVINWLNGAQDKGGSSMYLKPIETEKGNLPF